MTLVDVEDARTPALYEPLAVAAGGAVVAAAMAPRGAQLAVLVADGNQLIPVDISSPALPTLGAPVALLPDERVSLARELGYSPAGDELWVISGDNAESLRAGMHPTRLITVSVGAGDAGFRVERAAEIASGWAPTALAVARRESKQAAAATQTPSRRTPLVLGAVARGLLHGADDAQGQLVRIELDGRLALLMDEPGAVAAVALSHDASLVVAATVRAGDKGLELGVVIAALGGGEACFVPLGATHAARLRLPGAVAVAP